MSVDNPYYFYNDNNKSPKTPSDSTNKVFSFFKRRNSTKGSSTSSNCSKASASNQIRSINSATLSTDATALLGSPRCSLGSLGSNSGTSFLQNFETQNGNNTLNSLYRRPNNIQRERLGSFNESVTYHIENDDVFLQTARSHKTKTLPSESGNRRHSIGNLMNRNERQRCPSFSDEVPKMVAPKPPIVTPTKYSNRRKDNCNENLNMDDILIITAKHSERALSWASFLRTRFDKITKQRDRKRFNFLYIKIDDGPITVELAQKCQTTALQIAILCPTLLALPPKYLMSQFSAILNQDKILAVLLDVTEEKVMEIHKSAFPLFRKWRRCTVRENDQSSIGNILGISTDILGRALCQRPPCQEINSNGSQHSKVHRLNSNSIEEFTVMPRKVKIGQNKVLALLNDPLTTDDSIKIIIEKTGEIIEVKNFKQRNPYTLQFNIPETCMEISTMVEIRIEKNEKNLGSRPIKCESQLRELEQLLRLQDTPIEFMCHSLGIGSIERDLLDSHLLQCFQKNMPPNFHLFDGPFEQQNHFLSMRDCSPEEYPTLLHFAAKWGLERLCMQLLECPGGDTACEIKNVAGKTPADIAEYESFTKLSNSLKSFSQMHEFATMYHYFKGISDSTNTKVIIDTKSPSQSSSSKIISSKLSNNNCQLRTTTNVRAEKEINLKNNAEIEAEYMEMSSGSDTENQTQANNSTTLAVTNLNYINIESKDDSNNTNQSSSDELSKKLDHIGINGGDDTEEIMTNELKVTEPPYYQSNDKNKTTSETIGGPIGITADQFSQECSNLLDNCSVSSQSDYMLQPSNIPVEQNKLPLQENLNMSLCLNYMNDSIMSTNMDEPFQLKFSFDKNKQSLTNKNGTLKRTSSDASSTKGNADDELAEIMYDFKNNVLSIREVEQLVEKWKNRNDVKQSFKEKQEQIEKLRDEYDKIQEKMKENMKRPTPFERIKKIFSRNKSSNNNKNIAIEIYNNNDTKPTNRSFLQSNQRPISSLSLQSVSSSSSSGRMSTGSACSGTSLGDSGTHSDHEERRQLFGGGGNICRIGSPGSLMDNYLIPPVPRPVLTTPSGGEENDRLVFSSNHYRVTTPTNQISPTEHYILFPSNVPVFQENHQCGLNTIPETKETQNDLTNGGSTNAVVTPIKIHNSYEKNIIYGKLHKNRPKELCSSFKSQQYVQQQRLNNNIIDCKKEMSDVYQNINEPDDLKDKPKKFLSEDDINNVSRESSSYNNSTNNISFQNTEEEHNYINI